MGQLRFRILARNGFPVVPVDDIGLHDIPFCGDKDIVRRQMVRLVHPCSLRTDIRLVLHLLHEPLPVLGIAGAQDEACRS